MITRARLIWSGAVLGLALALPASAVRAAGTEFNRPAAASSADFVQHLGGVVPTELTFRDEHGTAVRLGDYLGAGPVGLVLSYYRCTNLCPMQIRNLAQRMTAVSGSAGGAPILVVSIDPLDTPALADRVKHKYLDDLLPPARAAHWHFLSGAAPEIASLATSLGFRYGYDEATQQFAHPDGFALISADGKIARYFFGFGYTAADLGSAFDQAAADRIASPIAHLLLVCFHYDIASGPYSALIMNVLRAASTIVLLAMLALGWTLLRRARRPRTSEA